MWDYEGYLSKAETYFTRAAKRENSADSLLWSVLGLELFARAALARISPVLNAAMDGGSILDSLGFPDLNGKQRKSIPMHTVLSRLPIVIDNFTPDRVREVDYLMELRNAELHTGQVRFEVEELSTWLPKLVRALAPLAAVLDVEVDELLGPEVAALGQSYVDEEDKKLGQEVRTRINSAKQFWDRLTNAEKEARTPIAPGESDQGARQDCPACGTRLQITSTAIRSSPPYLDGDDRVRRVENVVTAAECPGCGLQLDSTAEIHAAGLSQHFAEFFVEEVYGEYDAATEYVDDEYGND